MNETNQVYELAEAYRLLRQTRQELETIRNAFHGLAIIFAIVLLHDFFPHLPFWSGWISGN
jgi:hypothetical protein